MHNPKTKNNKALLKSKKNLKQSKLEKKIVKQCALAVTDFSMIEEGDKVMVCLSGGADSYTLLAALMHLQRVAPINFELVAVNLDQKQPGFPEHVLPNYMEKLAVEFHVVNEDTYSIVTDIIPAGKTTCSLCSRLRRGILYRTATELGATKIALGHHKDDMVETLFLNMFFAGKLKSMPPKLLTDDKSHIVIRPLAYCREKDIKRFAQQQEFPIIPCNLCGSQENLQRVKIKQMLQQWDEETPGRVDSVFNSMQNIVPSHLADLARFPFKSLQQENHGKIQTSAMQQKFTLNIR